MDKNDNSKRSPEPKSGVNFFLILILILCTVLLGVFFYRNMSTFEVKFNEFETFLALRAEKIDSAKAELSVKSDDISAAELNQKLSDIDFSEITLLLSRDRGTTQNQIRISNLQDIVVDDRRINGSLTMTVDDSDAAPVTRKFVVKKPLEGSEAQIQGILKTAGVDFSYSGGPTFFSKWGPFLIFSLALLALFFFMIRRLGGAGSPMQFGRSRGRLYAEEDLSISFNDVAGIDEAVEEVKEVVDFLSSPDKYQKLGGRIPKGVLLVGPPGTGKTLLARAIAGEANVPFFSLSGSDFVEMYVGVGAARVRDMFQQAETKAPSIIFIDELDALGKSRSGNMVGGHDEREQTLNALLVEMDGFQSNSGVIVVAATNRPETLDQALLRPGRFDRHVLVDRPDVRGREAILNVHVKNVKLGEDVELTKVASITPGFVGADLANLVNEAALRAAREGKEFVEMCDFDEGVERVTAGLEKKQRVMNEDEKLRVAYHESGHALVAYSLPNTDPVHKVSIIPRGVAALGYTMQRPDEDRYLMTKGELESRIQVLLAGTIAEEIIYSDISTGAQNDLERATDIARGMVMEYGMSHLGRINFKESNRSAFLASSGGDEVVRSVSEKTQREIDEEVRRIIEESVEKVRQILDVRKDCLVALTEKLFEVESVDATELKRIVDENVSGPLVVPGTENTQPNSKTASPITSPSSEEEQA